MKHWWMPLKPRKPQEALLHELFYLLVGAMEQKGIAVMDMMPGVSLMVRNPHHKTRLKAIVNVSWMGSWKRSFFILIHEAGHLMYLDDVDSDDQLITLKLRKKPAGEEQANITAIKILEAMELDHLTRGYVSMYNNLNHGAIKRGRRKKFTWRT